MTPTIKPNNMGDPRRRQLIITINSLLLILCISCSQKQLGKNVVYVNVYRDLKKSATLKFDDDVIYDKKGNANPNFDLDVIRGPFHFDKDKIKIHFSIDGKDTSFIYPLKKVNYISVGYSNRRHEFQFSLQDSTQFFMPRI